MGICNTESISELQIQMKRDSEHILSWRISPLGFSAFSQKKKEEESENFAEKEKSDAC
jgi:hypothetical protein